MKAKRIWIVVAGAVGWLLLGMILGWGLRLWWHPLSVRRVDENRRHMLDSLARRVSALEDSLARLDEAPDTAVYFTVRFGYWLSRPPVKGIFSGQIDSVAGYYFYSMGRLSDSTAAVRFRDWMQQRVVAEPIVVKIKP